MNTYNNSSTAPYGSNAATGNKKFKPYRNRPGKRQGLLELFSFFLILASAPMFLGGVFSIFISIATFALGIIGLFAWTRRHARFFILLAILVIAACIVNIILRATFHAQCVPFYEYRNNFGAAGIAGGAAGSSSNSTVVPAVVPTNSTVVPVVPVAGSTNSTNNTLASRDNNYDNYNNNGTEAFVGAAGGSRQTSINGNGNQYDHSIWCGNNYIVYIVGAIIIGLAAAALFFALSALNPRNKTPVTARTTETASTHTRTVATEQY